MIQFELPVRTNNQEAAALADILWFSGLQILAFVNRWLDNSNLDSMGLAGGVIGNLHTVKCLQTRLITKEIWVIDMI